MPLDNFITRPDFSRQIKQYSSTTANLSGSTKVAEDLFVKNIEIDTENPQIGNVLVYDGTKFLPAPYDAYGEVILNGMILSYQSGLTYNISSGQYRMFGATYIYTGGTVIINSGNSLYSRFDVVYVTGDTLSLAFVLSGTPSPTPTVPSLVQNQLQVGIISVGANFTGGTGTTIIQVTSDTVFEFYDGSTGIQRAGALGAEAIGNFSFALSRNSKSYGEDSVSLGLGTQASGNSQTVVGQYNTTNTDDYFIVGNGESSGSRSNAFRITTGGSAYVTNKLFVTNYEIETTGASNNFALIYDSANSKFKPQSLVTASGTITGLTSAGTGNILILSSLTNSNIVYKTISAGTGISIIESADGTLLFSGSASNSLTATTLGDGVKVLFSSDTTSLSFATLSSQTPSTLRIISSSTGVILFSAVTGSGSVGTLDQVTTAGNTTANDISVGDLSATTINIGTSGTIGQLITTSLTTDRQFNFPDRNGQILVSGYEYMDLSTAQAGGPFTIGQWYRIPVSSRTTVTESSNPNNYGDIILISVDTNKLSIDGYLLAINADYNSVGDYTDADTLAGGATTQRGVPYRDDGGSGINYVVKDIAIFNNIHWLCTSNKSNTKLLSELQDTNFFTALTKDYTSTYGYIIEADKITYDLSTDRILSRQDKRGNVIYETNSNLILDRFRFGDNNVTDNFIKASNVSNFDVLNIPENNFIFKDNTLTSFNKLFFDSITGGDFLQTGATVPVYISGVSINDGKFEAINKVTAYDGSINNYKSTIEETITLTSSTIDLRNKYLTGQIILQSGSGFNRVISSITQSSSVPYNVDVSFSILSGGVSGITFVNSDLMKTEGGISAFISGNTIDNIHFNKLYIGGIFYDTFRQININNYI